jgi:hypothetical protein
MFYTKILIKVEVKVVKFHFEVDIKAPMADEETFDEEEVVKVVVEVMEVNNQITTQTTIIVGNWAHGK